MRGLIAAMALFGLLAGAPNAASAPRDCGPRAATTIKRNRLVRVYETSKHNFSACARRTGKRTDIDGVARLHLRGRYVSYVSDACDRAGCSFQLLVLDVPAGDYPAATDFTPGYVLKTVATRYGEAAVLAESRDRSERFLLKVDWMGTSELDRGPGVHDLTLRDRRLDWRSGPAQRTAPAAHGRRCGPSRGVDTFALSEEVRVYTVYRTPGIDEYRDYYACLRPGGKPRKLVRENLSPDDRTTAEVNELVLSGRAVGFTEVNCYSGYPDCDSEVSVFDVRARRRVRTGHVFGYLYDLVVSPNGLAAGLVIRSNTDEDAVVGFDSRGRTELDHGPDLHDLMLDGTLLRWFNGSEQRTAELAGPS